MDFQTISAFVFIALMLLFLYIKRKKVERQGYFPFLYFSLYRTKLGISLMDRAAKSRSKALHFLAYSGVIVGFLGMLLIAYLLIANTFQIFAGTADTAAAGLVLPIRTRGTFYVPFFYWIISIFTLATIHEFSHGIVARLHNIKVKSSGFAFVNVLVPIIPAAFVEPDEEELKKKSPIKQMSVFAAGPFSNVIFAFLVVLFMIFILSPAVEGLFDPSGVNVRGFIQDNNITSPAELAGISENEIIKFIDDTPTPHVDNLTDILDQKSPGDTILLKTNESTYNITLASSPDNETKAYLGVYLEQNFEIKESAMQRYGTFIPEALIWLSGLFFWMYVLNLGIGLFNLVPLGPVDGGRILQLALVPVAKFFGKDEKAANKIWKAVSYAFIFLILVNILFPFFA